MPGVVESIVPTKYWHRLEDGRVQCDMCPRFCRLRDGQRGMCFVRACQGGEVVAPAELLVDEHQEPGFQLQQQPQPLPVIPPGGAVAKKRRTA